MTDRQTTHCTKGSTESTVGQKLRFTFLCRYVSVCMCVCFLCSSDLRGVFMDLWGANCICTITCEMLHTHNHFMALCNLSGITQVSRCQKGKTNLDFTDARDSEWQWHHQVSDAELNHTSVSGWSPATKWYLMNFWLKVPHLVATIFRSFTGNETSKWGTGGWVVTYLNWFSQPCSPQTPRLPMYRVWLKTPPYKNHYFRLI